MSEAKPPADSSGDLPEPPPTEATRPEPSGEEQALVELRALLVGDQKDQIDRLERRLDDPEEQLKSVSDVLPEAVRLRGERDDKLTRAMAPSIDEVIRESVKRRPKVLADALFPVMGPAIRKSIADTLQRFIQSLNQALEHSLSPRSFKWRLESWRTGRPFAEIVLSRTLLYRVEQVFLIHGETGLLLNHVAIPEIDTEDSDMVSGMLTAIQDFVRDSFSGGQDEGSGLRSAKVGELTLWAESGPRALVALVIRGTPPESLREDMDEVLEELHLIHGEAMADFEGDASPFEATEASLETLLVTQGQEFERKKGRGPRLALAFLAVVGIAVSIWLFLDIRDRMRWRGFLRDLESTPGVVLTAEDRGDREVRGLRDPLAEDPARFFHQHFDEDEALQSSFGLFRSNDADIVIKRARALLALPEAVEDSFQSREGVLSASGRAASAEIARAAIAALRIPGVESVDFSEVEKSDAEAFAARLKLIDVLKKTPGVVVMGQPDLALVSRLEVLVDPSVAADLETRLKDEQGRSLPKLAALDLVTRAFQSAEPAVLRSRIEAALGWPSGLEIEVRNEKLAFRGAASSGWTAAVAARPELWAAFPEIDLSEVQIAESAARRAWRAFVAELAQTPGIVVTSSSEVYDADDQGEVRGFRDPLAASPLALARDLNFEGIFSAQFETFASADPVIVLKRFRQAFSPPLELETEMRADGTLALGGRVTRIWWDRVREAASAIPGLQRLDIGALEIFDPVQPLEASWKALRQRLDAEPGYRVDAFAREGDLLRIDGRRDPLARDLGVMLAELGIATREVKASWRDFVSRHPDIALRRARQIFNPPATVALSMRDRTLVARGDASAAWRKRFEAEASKIAGVEGTDVRELRDFSRRELERLIDSLSVRVIVFGDGETEVGASQDAELDAAAVDLRAVQAAARTLGLKVRLEVVGLPDRLDAAQAPSFEADPEFYRARRGTALDRASVVKRLLAERRSELREALSAVGANERAWRSPEEGALARRLGAAVVFRGTIQD